MLWWCPNSSRLILSRHTALMFSHVRLERQPHDAGQPGSDQAALPFQADALRSRWRRRNRRDVRVLPPDDRGLPRRLAGGEGAVLALGRGSPDRYGTEPRDVRATVDDPPARTAFR